MTSAEDGELREVLQALIAGVRPVLAANYVGAYLVGSFALGGAVSHSDVDFLIVVQADVPASQEAALQAEHVRVYGLASDWARHLEGSYFPQALLREPATVGQPLLYIDNGRRVLERSAHDNTLVARWVLREHGLTLDGPAPSRLLDSVPPGALRREVQQTLQAWGVEVLGNAPWIDNDWAQPYLVLSMCRMRQSLETGQVHAKPAAAAWAKRHLDPRWAGLIDRASAAHERQRELGRQRADPAELASTIEFVREAVRVSHERGE
jgi:predicted nucleotidyltransferase